MPLSIEFLKSILHYDPTTGIFTWLKSGKGRRPSMRAGSRMMIGYERIAINQISYLSHRLAWFYMTGAWPTKEVDHKNMDRADNRFENLREATVSQNRMNRTVHRNNKSGYKGVCLDKRNGRYIAYIKRNRKSYFLGSFNTAVEAHEAYCLAAKDLFEEYHRISYAPAAPVRSE